MLTDTEKKLLLRYVQPTGNLPEVFNTKAGAELLIIGSAACVVDDLER